MTHQYKRSIRLIVVCLVILLVGLCWTTVESQAATGPSATGTVNSSIGLNVRTGPSTSYKVSFVLKHKAKITVTEKVYRTKSSTSSKNIWYKIKYGSKTGYVRSDYVNNLKYTAVSGKTNDQVFYRYGAGTGMKLKGSFNKGTGLTIYMKCRAYNSSVPWYMVKYAGGYYYSCGTYITLNSSIFENGGNSGSSGGSGSSASGGSSNSGSSSSGSGSSSSSFETQLKAFPASYQAKLSALHKEHPNWQFKALNTGINWNDALAKESRDGVSLIYYTFPLSYRDTSSYSYKVTSSTRSLYKTASTSSSKLGTVSANTKFTVLDEVFTSTKASDSYKFMHVKLSNGRTGYIQGSATSESYAKTATGTVKGGTLNVRKGASTSWGTAGSLSNNSTVSIVLKAKQGSKTWYKIKYGSSYGYVSADYITVKSSTQTTTTTGPTGGAISGKTVRATNYYDGPSTYFHKQGTLSSGQTVTLLKQTKDVNGSTWYQAVIGGVVYYVSANDVTPSKTLPTASASNLVQGTVTDYLNYRTAPDEKTGKTVGTFSKGKKLTITGATKSVNYTWYRISYNNKTYYVATGSGSKTWVTINPTKSSASLGGTTTTSSTTSLSDLAGTASFIAKGTWIPKDGSTWFNASKQVIAYYMDPRNFLNGTSIYQFLDLGYHSYQNASTVSKVLAGSAYPRNGYQSQWFVNAGKKYNVSPIHLASRARQENGGGGFTISGYNINGTLYYNPFNIGAYSSSNPALVGMQYAKQQGWNTKQKAIEGGAKFIANGYINNKQNTIYLQRFNVAKGLSNVGTHQYMTNLTVGATEASTMHSSYSSYGLEKEPLVFLIPVYNNMPSSTSLPS